MVILLVCYRGTCINRFSNILLPDLSKLNKKIKIEINVYFLHIVTKPHTCIFMTPITNESRMSTINTITFYREKKNNYIINNIIDNNPNILKNFMNKYNNLSDDVKDLLHFSENLQKTISSLQNTVCRVKSEYNQLQKQLTECKIELSIAENRAQQVTESSCVPENICVICMTNPRECVYVSCGHVCACIECCRQMGSQCPICRQNGNFIKLISV